ncbi:MAG: hypothetical protein P8O20_06115 [Bacteroidia bacterium]|nr:hypothetical protein [Bacteroidia bacterium]
MQISGENIKILQEKGFVEDIYANAMHDLRAQTKLEKAYGKIMGRFATMQRKILPKALKKIPTWHKYQCFYLPKSYEQSTSEAVAMAKMDLFKGGNNLLSLTGGLGVDDWALSKKYEEIISLDTNEDLNRIVRSNYTKLGTPSIKRIHDSAEDFLASTDISFDTYYIDPDRRDAKGTKGLDAAVFSPNILTILENHPEIKKDLWIKLSPATDLTWIRENIHPEIDIYVIDYQQEVKEVLCHLSHSQKGLLEIISIQTEIHRINKDTDALITPSQYDILWEPSSSVIKSDFLHFTELGSMLSPCNENKTLFYGTSQLPQWYGKVWKILEKGKGGMKQLKKELTKLGIINASVTCKTYPLKPAEIMKKLKLKESSKHQIYFTTHQGIKEWFIVERIKR